MFGWNALSVMLKEQGNYDRQCTQPIAGALTPLTRAAQCKQQALLSAGCKLARAASE